MPSLMNPTNVPNSTAHPLIPIRLDEKSKQLYLHHEAITQSLAGKDKQYLTALRRARASFKEASEAADIHSQVVETEKNLTAELDQLESKKIRKRLFPNRTNEEITKVRNNLTTVAEQAALAKKTATQTRRQARSDARLTHTLRPDAEKYLQSEKIRRAILESVYGGSNAGSVQENNIETERDRLQRVTYRAKDSLSAQKAAYQFLKTGLELLNQARRHLFDAQVTNTVDLFNGGGLGFVAGLSTQYRFQGAAKVAREAGKKIERAVVINPDLPIAKMINVQNPVFLSLADVFLDGIVTDLVVRLAVEKAVKSLNAAMESTEKSIEYQKRVVEEAQGSFKGVSEELERTSDELTDVRASLFHEAIQ